MGPLGVPPGPPTPVPLRSALYLRGARFHLEEIDRKVANGETYFGLS